LQKVIKSIQSKIDMKTKVATVPFSVFVVGHPTIIGMVIPLSRVQLSHEEEIRIEKVGRKAEESGERLRKALAPYTQPHG
jgi:hypothetical protein